MARELLPVIGMPEGQLNVSRAQEARGKPRLAIEDLSEVAAFMAKNRNGADGSDYAAR